MSTGRLDTKARQLIDARKDAKAKETVADKAKAERDRIELELWDALRQEHGANISTITMDLGEGYGVVQLQRRETITAEILNKDVAAESLEQLGLAPGMLGEPTIRKKPLNQHVKELKEAGQQPPDGIGIRSKKYITVTFKK